MRKIKLDDKARLEMAINIKKIIGQLQTIGIILDKNQATGQTLNQLLAVKGGVTSLCKHIISRGIIPDIDNYSKDEIDTALDIIFKV